MSIGCLSDAERDNPLDTFAENYQPIGKLFGRVTSFYRTDIILPAADLDLEPAGRYTISGSDGLFEFNNLPSGNYTLICSKEGYRPDTVFIEINTESKEKNFRLNSLPRFEQIELNTHHVSRWWPAEESYFLRLKAQVRDKDGINEIDSVWFSVPSISFAETLFISNLNGIYEQTITEDQLPLASLRQLEGKTMALFCRDIVNNISVSDDLFLPRLIQEVPVQVSPTGLETINSFPLTFMWEQVFLPYTFTYKIEIYQVNFGFFSRITEITDILSNQIFYEFTNELPAGDYFWLLYVVDEFGDTSSSKEGAFRVQ
jgi:hypothetical protein